MCWCFIHYYNLRLNVTSLIFVIPVQHNGDGSPEKGNGGLAKLKTLRGKN